MILRPHRAQVTSALVSLVVHLMLMIALGLLLAKNASPSRAPELVFTAIAAPTSIAELNRETVDPPPVSLVTAPIVTPLAVSRVELAKIAAHDASAKPASVPVQRLGFGLASGADFSLSAGADPAAALDGRSAAVKARLLEKEGGTPQSEEAVLKGLNWLRAHQDLKGCWYFDHTLGPCHGYCRNPGTVASTTGATAIALLCFLGAGKTHREGEFQEVVQAGLNYLVSHQLQTPHGGDLQEGTMYAQGLATMALCEAYAMTHDKTLEYPAQRALDFIVYAQDKHGGGWRYSPGEPGDITVTGWQLMALKSGRMAYLHVPTATMAAATRFLDKVQVEKGTYYGYMKAEKEPTTTSVGLLCRMVTGWRREHPQLVKGVRYLSQQGPEKENMYFNYYATQVLHHWGGAEWVAWNQSMRQYLIETQGTRGHESGSWYFSMGHGSVGGRLYNTAMAIMTLEVYYRYMPLYGQNATEDF